MSKGKLMLGAGVVLASAVLLAGCSSSGESKSASGPSASSGAGASNGGSTANKSAIPLGIIGSYSGSQAPSTGKVPDVAQAWASTVNAAGGIDGHPVKLYVKDDAGNPAAGLTAAKELVQQDKVVAFVGDASNVDSAWAPYVESAGVPVVGGLSLNVAYLSNPDFFAAGTNGIAVNYGTLAEAKTLGSSFAVLYCQEAAACKQGATLDTALAPVVGVKLALTIPISATAPDYTAVCQRVKSSGVESYAVLDAGGVALRVVDSCKQQGVTAKLVTAPGTITSSWLGDSAVNGTVGVEATAPFFDTSVPATQAYRAAIARYVPDIGTQDGGEESTQWVAGKLFEAAVQASASSTVTAASIKTGLYALKGETLGGLTQPLTYKSGQPNLFNCWFTLGVQNGKFTTPNGLKTTCAPDAVIDQVLKASK